MKARNLILIAAAALAAAACSTTRALGEGEYLLRKNTIETDDASFNVNSLSSYIGQKPNSYIAGVNPLLSVYNWGGFFKKVGAAPVIFDSYKLEQSRENILNHLTYMGYYGSAVSSRVEIKHKKAYVTYEVKLGKRYTISDIQYEIPEYGTFLQEFNEDLPSSTVKKGQFLSESSLEKETERQSAYFRNRGYYGFSKAFYAFEADTLPDGTAHLKMAIRDYALGDSPASAQEHRKYTIGKVSITHQDNLKIKPSVLENLNILRPGQDYSESLVNANYSRFSNVPVLTGVNIELEPVEGDKVDCTISLRNSGLQGVKTDIEASVNSTGLFGISPQLTYYHRNIFHGGELFNMGVKGNFQFKPRTSAYSTEVSVSSSLRFPKMIGFSNRLFKGPYIPTTDISVSFAYQDRPEFRRTLISTAFTWNGRAGQNLFYQFTPVRANISHLYGIDAAFMEKLIVSNPFVFIAYMDHFDLGVSGTLYYTTNASTVPTTPYHYVRVTTDISGNAVSLFNRFLPVNEDGQRTVWDTPYAQYVRTEVNLGKVFRFGREDRQAIALHFGAGAALAYGNSDEAPIEKMFYAGGAMSMRGWQARTLGPGTSEYIEDFAIPSQVGDMKLEANAEYRFPMFSKLEGALFVDCGNIWDIGKNSDEDSRFSLATLPESLALNWGFGFRLNLDFLLLRLDTGIRVRDPMRSAGDRWVPANEILNGNIALHFGVGYPF